MHQSFELSGNIAIFAQSEAEFEEVSEISKQVTLPSDNPNQKYFELIEPIIFVANDKKSRLTHLYIRKFDSSDYGKYLGDVDFIVEPIEYSKLKKSVTLGEINGAEIYDRPGWDNIQISNSNFNVVSYLSTKDMVEKIRVKFDSLTNI